MAEDKADFCQDRVNVLRVEAGRARLQENPLATAEYREGTAQSLKLPPE
jgi:hypothetical protein